MVSVRIELQGGFRVRQWCEVLPSHGEAGRKPLTELSKLQVMGGGALSQSTGTSIAGCKVIVRFRLGLLGE